jgi:membrane-bound ClpP family serine protease
MSLFGIILMILAGLVLFLLELLVIPGISVAGIGALVMMGAAVFLSFSIFGSTTGFLVLLGVLVSMGVTIALTFRSKTWKRVSLSTEMKSKVKEENDWSIKVGDQGVTLTRLNPAGTVQIGNDRVEGRSLGHFIDHQTPVEVIGVEPNHVVVKPINE